MSHRRLALPLALLALGCAGAPVPPVATPWAPPAPMTVPIGTAGPAATPTATPVATPTPVPTGTAPPLAIPCASPAAPLTVAGEPLDADGLPHPGAIAIGARVDALTLMRRVAPRALLGDVVGTAATRHAAYDLAGGVTLVIAFNRDGAGAERVAGVRVTAKGGLTAEAARAWLLAAAPCYPVPALGTAEPGADADLDYTSDTGTSFPASFGDRILLTAARRADSPDWQRFGEQMVDYGGETPLVLPASTDVPAGRWAGVAAFAYLLGK
jgi:hypothetical protein